MLSRSTLRIARLYSFARPSILSSGFSTVSRKPLPAIHRSAKSSASTLNITRKHFRIMSTLAESEHDAVDFGNYERLTEFKLAYAPVTVAKYRSKKTGFSVVVANNKAPITNAYFTVATEIFDDTGRPHTLEHLVFLGSKNYPYKGVLDNLANRAGGDGTNAWTADDHTAYTISTAGSEGFLNMLPIYLDHILYPTITASGFTTEVFHVNGKGEEAGVVMSEMQGVEQNPTTVLARKLQLELYPEGSAYRSETGGMLDALRKLTVEEIREFHASAYRPYNVCLLVDGSIPVDKLMRVLNDEVDPLILSRAGKDRIDVPADWKRPFLETASSKGPKIDRERQEVVEFMDKDESMGEMYLAWRGNPTGDHLQEMALDLLTTYLTDTEVAPLNKRFVEIPKPLCTAIGFYSSDRASASEITCHISGVPRAMLESMTSELKSALKEIASGTAKEGALDMKRMRTVIERDRRQLLATAETRLTDVLCDPVITDFLYGDNNAQSLAGTFDDLQRYDVLLDWSAKQWIELLQQYFVNQPCVSIVGKPSAAMVEKISRQSKERLEMTKSALGEAGLKRKAQELEAAQTENDRPIPSNMITDFPISDASKIDWIPVESAVNPAGAFGNVSSRVQAHIESEGQELPYSVHYAHVASNFVTIRTTFDASCLPSELMPYLKIFESSLFSLPVERPEGVIDHEEVVNQLTEVTVDYDSGLGLRGEFSDVFQVYLKVEKNKYAVAIGWLRDLLSRGVFDIERLSVVSAKLLQDLPRRKRSANSAGSSTIFDMLFDKTKSPSIANGLLGTLNSLPSIAEELKQHPQQVIKKLETLREHLLDPAIMRVSVAGDVLSIEKPRSAFSENFLPFNRIGLRPLKTARDVMTPLGLAPARKAKVITMPSTEGSYGVVYGKGPFGWDAEGLAAADLAAGVLNALESYFWKHIRGAGLAYGASIDVDEEAGLTSFKVWRSPDAYKAYKAAGDVVRGLADGSIELETNLVDAARSTMSYTMARSEGNNAAAASTVFINEVFKQIPADTGARRLASLKDVSVEQVRAAIQRYFVPLFKPESSVVAVASATGLDEKIAAQFKEAGYEVEVTELPSLGDNDADGSGSEGEGSDGDSEGSGSEDESMSARSG